MSLRPLAVALAVSATAALAAAPAQALDLWTGTTKTKGRAHYYGSSILINKQRQVHIKGVINDVCPGDGYGAVIRITIRLRNGKEIVKAFRDTEECSGPGTEIDYTTKRFPGGVLSGGEQLFEIDHDTGAQGDITSYEGYTWNDPA
jgi:hypothetical protein